MWFLNYFLYLEMIRSKYSNIECNWNIKKRNLFKGAKIWKNTHLLCILRKYSKMPELKRINLFELFSFSESHSEYNQFIIQLFLFTLFVPWFFKNIIYFIQFFLYFKNFWKISIFSLFFMNVIFLYIFK